MFETMVNWHYDVFLKTLCHLHQVTILIIQHLISLSVGAQQCIVWQFPFEQVTLITETGFKSSIFNYMISIIPIKVFSLNFTNLQITKNVSLNYFYNCRQYRNCNEYIQKNVGNVTGIGPIKSLLTELPNLTNTKDVSLNFFG